MTISVLRRNVIANFVGRGLSAGLGILLIPRYTHYLGIEALGLVTFYAMLNQAFNLLDMGLSATLNREMAKRTVVPSLSSSNAGEDTAPIIAPERAQEARNLVRSLEIVYWPIALLIALGVIALAPFIAHHWLQASQLAPSTLQKAVMLMGLSLAVQWPYTLYEGGLMGLQRHVVLNGIITAMALVRGLGALVVVWRIPTVEAFFGWQILSNAILTGLVCVALWGSLPRTRHRSVFDADALRQLWRFALGMTGITALGFILTQMDKFLLSRQLHLREYGYYGLAWTAAGGIYFIIAPLYSAFFPRFVQISHVKSRAALSELYHRACQIMAVAILPVAATMALFSRELLLLWTRKSTVAELSATYLTLMAISFGLFGLMHIPLATMLAKDKTRYLLVHNLLSVLIAVPTLFLAVQRFGPLGACYVWMGVNAAYLLIMVPVLHSILLRGELWRWFSQDTLAPGVSAFAVVLLARQLFPTPSTVTGLLLLLLGVGTFALIASAFAASHVRTWIGKYLKQRLSSKSVEKEAAQRNPMPSEHVLSAEPGTASTARPEAAPTAREHFGYLDGLRAMAALYVVVHHAWLHPQPTWIPSGWTGRLTIWLQFGHFAVDVFIVLSGFCLMLPVVRSGGALRGGVKGFLLRRARRILPPYFAAVAFSLLLIWTLVGRMTGTHWDVSLPIGGYDILAHLLLIQDVLPQAAGAKINHPLWSVAVEWHIYFLFPLLVSLWRRWGGMAVASLTTLLSYIAGVIAVKTGFLEGMHFQYVGLFALGMLGAAVAFSPLERWRTLRERLPWGILALAVLLVALACGLIWRRVHGITIYVDPLIGVSTSALLIGLSRPGKSWLKRMMEWKPLVFVGSFSYSLYLIHAPLLQLVWQYGIHPLQRTPTVSFWILVFLGCPIILFLAYLFFLICERPFIMHARTEKRTDPSNEDHTKPATLTAP